MVIRLGPPTTKQTMCRILPGRGTELVSSRVEEELLRFGTLNLGWWWLNYMPGTSPCP